MSPLPQTQTEETNKFSLKRSWSGAIAQPGKSFSPSQLEILAGKIPGGLRGTLYRNGAARLERGGVMVGHWFDGDGAILAINFRDTGAVGTYRYVETAGYQAETTANKFLYGNYGMTAPGPIWNQWRNPVKNAANTSVLALPDRLLALWEGGNPHSLDLETLVTQGLDNLGGLDPQEPYSAHPRVDYATQEIFNFGMTPGPNGILTVYKSNGTGKIVKKAKFTLKGFPLIHDFVLAGPYLIFFAPAMRLNIWSVLLGMRTYSQSLKWRPEVGTQILVIDRESLSLVSRGITESWFQWHFANGYLDPSGTVIVDFARYPDFHTNQYLQEVATGVTRTLAKTTLTRVQLNPQTGKVIVIQNLLDRHCEFPSVPLRNVGKASRYTYMSLFREGTDISQEILNGIARFDHETETLTEANFGENLYPSEPISVPDAENPQQTWVLTVVYDGNLHQSQVWIFAGDRLDAEPVCRLELPEVIPHSFHGVWKSA
jgi:carotenoid cleavage dioxygenase-like enzyme